MWAWPLTYDPESVTQQNGVFLLSSIGGNLWLLWAVKPEILRYIHVVCNFAKSYVPCDILLNMVSYIFFLGQLWTWELTSKVTVIRSSKSIHVPNSLACCCEVCRWSIKVLWVISSFYSFSHLVWPFPKIQSARAVTGIHHHTKFKNNILNNLELHC